MALHLYNEFLVVSGSTEWFLFNKDSNPLYPFRQLVCQVSAYFQWRKPNKLFLTYLTICPKIMLIVKSPLFLLLLHDQIFVKQKDT